LVSGIKQGKKTIEIQEKLRNNSYYITPEQIELKDEQIGKGASGFVRKGDMSCATSVFLTMTGIWLKTTTVAVKALNNVPEFTSEEEIEEFYKEIEILR
jgi:hypothetical protein